VNEAAQAKAAPSRAGHVRVPARLLALGHAAHPPSLPPHLDAEADHAPHAVGEAGHGLPNPVGVADDDQARALEPLRVQAVGQWGRGAEGGARDMSCREAAGLLHS